MSGLELLGVVASAATLAELSLKIYRSLFNFVKEVGEADSTARDLRSQIHRFHKITDSVWSTLRHREKQADVNQLAQEEIDIWETIKECLDACERSLQKFENELESLDGLNESPGSLKKAALQLKLERMKPSIAKLEKTIDSHLQMMQMHMDCLGIIMHQENRNEFRTYQERLDRGIANSSSHLGTLRQKPQPSIGGPPDLDTDSAIDFEYDKDDAKFMEKSIDVAIAVRSAYDPEAYSVKLRRDPLGDEEPPRDHLSEPRTQANRSRSNSDVSLLDPTPDFDDTTHQDVLTALIERFKIQVKKDISSHHYIQAERNQIQTIALLEELQDAYNVPFNDYVDMQKSLLELYLKQGKFHEVQETVHGRLQGRVKPQAPTPRPTPMIVSGPELARAGESYHFLSRANRGIYLREKQAKYIEAAERDAKRAFKCRRELAGVSDPTFLETVQLLVEVYEDQGKMVHADTYRSLYLQPQPIKRSSPPDNRDENSPPVPTDLISAIMEGRDEVIGDLLQQRADVEISRRGKSALQYALDSGNEKTVRKLLNKGAEPNSGLHYAVRTGNWRMTLLLLDHADIEAKDKDGLTPLLAAAEGTNAPVVLMLLDRRADVTARGQLGWTVLHYAAQGGSSDVMRALLNPQYEVDINAVCTEGKTALHRTAELGKSDLAEILLDHRADLYAEDIARRTCFHLAVRHQKYDFVKMLLSKNFRYQRSNLPPTSHAIRNMLDDYELSQALLLPPKSRRGSSATSTSSGRKSLSSFFRPRSN